MTPEERLDRIDRIIEETATIQKANAVAIGQLSKSIDFLATAQKAMIEAQEILLRTMDRLAQLWGRSPN